MRSTISTLATVAAGLLASTVSAQGKVAIYWGQGYDQKELSVVCKDPSVDIVNIAFVNGFPKDRNTYPDTNFGNACGGAYFKNPDGTTSKFLASCGIITDGITECHKNGKKVLLSLGGGYPTDYYIANDDAAKWLAEVLVGSFGPQTSDKWPRPFGASVVDGFDLDIESSSTVGAQKYQYYAELVNYIKKLSPGMLISAAPQCVVRDAHLDDAISRAPFDYVFTQFYNTDECSAKRGWQDLNKQQTGFTFDQWTKRLQEVSYNKGVKLFMGLPASPSAANVNHYLLPEQADALITKYQKTPLWGGVMLWEAAASQNNTVYGQGYSTWIKYSIAGTFKQNYHPVVSSTIRSSSTLVSSTRSSTVSSKTSTPVPTTTSSSKSSVAPSSTVKSSSSTVKPSSSSVASSSTVKSSSSSVASSSTAKSSSSAVASSTILSSSSAVVSSSTVKSSSSSVASSTVESSSSVYVTSSSSATPSETSSVEYTDYFSTAIPTEYSPSSTAEPSTVYPEDVSSTVVQSSSSADVTSSASSYYETSSSVDVTSSASSYYETSSSVDVTSSASSYYETSTTPAVTSSASDYSDVSSPVPTASTSESSDYSSYSASSSSADYEMSSSTTPIDASSTPCTTSTELYPESSKTPEASTASETLSYSESSKVPEASSTAPSSSAVYSTESSKTPEASTSSGEYPTESSKVPEASSSSVEYSTESSKTPEASTAYSASSSTPADASSTPCTTSTELYPTSSETPEASSATDYTYYSESSPIPTVSSKTSEYPIVSVKTPEPSEFEFYSTATPTVTKPAESTTTVVTTTYLDTCSTGLTTKTAVITKTVCNACAKPSDKPEGDYPSDWTTSVYVSKTLTVTITKPVHPATDVPAYPTIVSEYPTAPKPSTPAAEYPVDKEEIPSYETPAKSSSVPYEATKPSPKPEVPAHEKPSAPAAEYPVASSKPSYPEDATVTVSQYVTLTKVATPIAGTPVPYPTPIGHQSYPVGNGTVPSSTGAVKPSATGTGKPVKPSSYTPPEFEGAASKLSMGMTGVVAVVALLVL